MEQFVDLCILLGCDYCESIRGIGPKKAFELIKSYGNIESILENLDQKKYPPPTDWPYQRARKLFLTPEVSDCNDINVNLFAYLFYKLSFLQLVWKEPDVDGIINFMCGEKSFKYVFELRYSHEVDHYWCGDVSDECSEDRIRSAIAKMKKGRGSSTQGRIDMFFTVEKTLQSEPTSAKRKAHEEKKVMKKRGPPLKKSK
uniref:Flap endonuclease 1 n=1 Tax=Angiostrongylus cantonensis TaxID=6313 RepID=A0A0K0D1B5_ANGCA